MLSIETLKWRMQMGKVGPEFDLVFWKGKGRIVASGKDSFALLVRGKRADYTWDRAVAVWSRLQENHELCVDELGGQHDAVGLVSLFASLDLDELEVVERDGLLRLKGAKGKPVRSYPGAMLPRSWAPLERKISGN